MCLTNEMGITFIGRMRKKKTLDNLVQVDEKNVYFCGKAISKERWRAQSLDMGLPPDIYLDIASKAANDSGCYPIKIGEERFMVQTGSTIQSRYGQHREVVSVSRYR